MAVVGASVNTCRVSGELYQAYLAKDMWHLFDSSSVAQLVNYVLTVECIGRYWVDAILETLSNYT